MKRTSQSWLTPKASTETTKKRAPWIATLLFWCANVQCRFHQ